MQFPQQRGGRAPPGLTPAARARRAEGERRERERAAVTLQRHVRGLLARRRAAEERKLRQLKRMLAAQQ